MAKIKNLPEKRIPNINDMRINIKKFADDINFRIFASWQ